MFEEEVDSGPDLSEKLGDIEAQFKSIQVCIIIIINVGGGDACNLTISNPTTAACWRGA